MQIQIIVESKPTLTIMRTNNMLLQHVLEDRTQPNNIDRITVEI